jgi:Domain of unknown function (DUF4430)
VKRVVALLVVAVLAACGGGDEQDGNASLWITRDRGAQVLFDGTVSAGLTVMQALRQKADVETRYGGRFVQSIDGLEGSLRKGRDWFFFVNGVAADRGAAEYRLERGDIAWWDYREWQGEGEVRIVVGAFPEPFLRGYGGRTRPAHVRYERSSQAAAARRIGEMIEAESVARSATPVPPGANGFLLVAGPPSFRARLVSPRGPYTFVLAGDANRLAHDPDLARFRYEGLP